jgi:hypothetical protein
LHISNGTKNTRQNQKLNIVCNVIFTDAAEYITYRQSIIAESNNIILNLEKVDSNEIVITRYKKYKSGFNFVYFDYTYHPSI